MFSEALLDGFLSTFLFPQLIQLPSLTLWALLTLGFLFPKHSHHILTLEPLMHSQVSSSHWSNHRLLLSLSSFHLNCHPFREALPDHFWSRADPNIVYFSSCLFLSQHPSKLTIILLTCFLLSVLTQYKFHDSRFVLSCLLPLFKH